MKNVKMQLLRLSYKIWIIINKIRTCFLFIYFFYLSSSPNTMLTLSKTTSPQKLFRSDCIPLYIFCSARTQVNGVAENCVYIQYNFIDFEYRYGLCQVHGGRRPSTAPCFTERDYGIVVLDSVNMDFRGGEDILDQIY